MHWYDHMNWGWGGGLMMILWIVLLAALIFWIVRSAQRSSNGHPQTDSAMDILKKRYARGEISKEEFDERKKDLL
jgi:putative membrane protein